MKTVTRTRVTTVTSTTSGGQTTTVSTTTESEGEGDALDTIELDEAMAAFSGIGERLSAEFSAASKRVADASQRLHKQATERAAKEKK